MVAATTDQPAETALVLKTSPPPAEASPAEQPMATPPVIVEQFLLPLPPPTPQTAPTAASDSTPAPSTMTGPTDAAQSGAQATVDPGALVFQLSLNAPTGSSKPQPESKPNQPETPTFSLPSETAIPSEPHASGSNAQSKNQDQQEQQQAPPAAVPEGSNGTIASQFGFQTPLTFAAHVTAVKTEAVAPTRAVENVSNTPDLPAAPAVDRIALTIRGANDEVVRVAVNQSGELVQVGVNSSNSALASELRGSVPELMRHLDQQGYESKVSFPSSATTVQAPIATASTEFRSGADSNGNSKSNSDLNTQDEPKQQRQRNSQRAWRELASQLQED